MVEPSPENGTQRRRRSGWMREQVLHSIRLAKGPISGWVIACELSKREGGIHTSAVFRSVNELLAAGLVERIETLACYVPNRRPSIGTVCIDCGSYQEIAADRLATDLAMIAREAGWTPTRLVTEVVGRCPRCSATKINPRS